MTDATITRVVLAALLVLIAAGFAQAKHLTGWVEKSRSKLVLLFLLLAGTIALFPTTQPVGTLLTPQEQLQLLAMLATFGAAFLIWLGFISRAFVALFFTPPVVAKPKPTSEPKETLEDKMDRLAIEKFDKLPWAKTLFGQEVRRLITETYHNRPIPAGTVQKIDTLVRFLPSSPLFTLKPNGRTFLEYMIEHAERIDADTASHRDLDMARLSLDSMIKDKLFRLRLGIVLPDHLRTEHMHVVAKSGHGKSRLFEQLILDDIATGASVVVIESQNTLVDRLATRVPADRLILVDPKDCAPGLNMFDVLRADDEQINTAVEFFEYIFASLDAEMTSKQRTVYRFVSRLVLAIPGGTIHTLREILDSGAGEYAEAVRTLSKTAQAFFATEYESKQYAETRKEISRRLYSVLDNPVFENMIGASKNTIDLRAALDSGKVVLISTAKNYIKATGAELLGRIFIAQVMQAVLARDTKRPMRRTYLYIDELRDYAKDTGALTEMLAQARKRELGIIVAHQMLADLPPELDASLAANTSIKAVGQVGDPDLKVLASRVRSDVVRIMNLPKGHFEMLCQGMVQPFRYEVDFTRLDKTPVVNQLSDIHAIMRSRYAVKATSRPAENMHPERTKRTPPPEKDTGDDEIGKW